MTCLPWSDTLITGQPQPYANVRTLNLDRFSSSIQCVFSGIKARAWLDRNNATEVVTLTTRWLSKFRFGDLSLQESDRSGRPTKIDDDVLRSMLENNPHLTSREIAEEFVIYHTTVGDHIKSLGHNVEPFLDKLITGDEKWILYENIKRKKSYCKPGTSSTTVPKPSIHQRKVLLCLW
ncbi:histone-lysine N-methyltransferase SETMAR [Trichonephila clavipes]|uniref:Histone-lysine N-methyltransferase SETMAR n=1 Tax=Trichonephila clavipes TaxID=2585209 RepID=A0A8X6SRK1_TRICX|nr:histone-lysine N-methyltransferase SETMAR [Trichonephila clavipes]